jgi:Fur family peroxide stress response transcriptional regulator
MNRDNYKGIGIKLTPQRIAILECLEGNTKHPSAEDIYHKVSGKFPTMSLATVYNTLDTLKKLGKLSELKVDADKKRFDPNIKPHHHLICLKCRKVHDIHIDFDPPIPQKQKKGFRITGNHIEFYGICRDCNGRRPVKTDTRC